MLVSNFYGDKTVSLRNVKINGAAPVFPVPTTVSGSASEVSLTLAQNTSLAGEVRGFIRGDGVVAEASESGVRIKNPSRKPVTIEYISPSGQTGRYRIDPGKEIEVR